MERPDPVIAADPVGALIDSARTTHGLGTATYDAGRRYRYRLSRLWDTALPRCCFVMLNPSTADATVLDPTVRRCLSFARAWGFGAVEVVNIYALRATHPSALRRAEDPPSGPATTAQSWQPPGPRTWSSRRGARNPRRASGPTSYDGCWVGPGSGCPHSG